MAKPARTQPPYEYQAWPAWFYGPKGHAGIFEDAESVPAGWVDHPSKVPLDEAPAGDGSDKSLLEKAAAALGMGGAHDL